MGLEAGGRGGVEEKEKEEEEKIPHMCESIGHGPLQGRCPAFPSTSSTSYLGRARVQLTTLRFCDYYPYASFFAL